MKAWGSVGVSLPHSSGQQYNRGRPVAKSDLQLGDLVFFYSGISHVGIYAGNGRVIHAPHPGKSVEYIKMSYMPYARSPSAGLSFKLFPAHLRYPAYAAFCVSVPQPERGCARVDGYRADADAARLLRTCSHAGVRAAADRHRRPQVVRGSVWSGRPSMVWSKPLVPAIALASIGSSVIEIPLSATAPGSCTSNLSTLPLTRLQVRDGADRVRTG